MKHVIRPLPLLGAFVALGAALVLWRDGSAPWWVVPAGVIGPDLSFLAAIGAADPGNGLMPSRVVRPYNLVHHPGGPLALAVVSLVVGSPALLAFPAAWGSHLLWDRGVGYGMRARDGSIMAPRGRTGRGVHPGPSPAPPPARGA